ncbi:hypothetical protein [Kitasatospora sp. NPDC088783]
MDDQSAYVQAADQVPGTTLISPRRAHPGGRSLYEPDTTGR